MKRSNALFASLLLVVLTVTGLSFSLIAPAPSASIEDKPWLNGWDHRKSHVIEGSIGAGTDYQVKIVAHYANGTDAGSDVYLNQKCQKNFNDVRFTAADGESLLSYWLETKVDGDYAVFWVKINQNLDCDQKIYVHYGNKDAASASNIEATFPFADNFSGTSLNSNKWRVYGHGTATFNEGICVLESVAGDRGWIYLYGKTLFGPNYAVRSSSLVIEQGYYRWTHHGFATLYNDSSHNWGRIDEYPNYITASQEAMFYAWTLRTRSYANTSRLDLSDRAPPIEKFFTCEIQRNGTTNAILTLNDTYQGSISSNVPSEHLSAMFSADNAGSELYSVTAVDWVVIRKYVAIEPQNGVWGLEESLH